MSGQASDDAAVCQSCLLPLLKDSEEIQSGGIGEGIGEALQKALGRHWSAEAPGIAEGIGAAGIGAAGIGEAPRKQIQKLDRVLINMQSNCIELNLIGLPMSWIWN